MFSCRVWFESPNSRKANQNPYILAIYLQNSYPYSMQFKRSVSIDQEDYSITLIFFSQHNEPSPILMKLAMLQLNPK